MLQYTVRPIDQWPGEPRRDRKYSPFKATWTDTLNLLETELRFIGAKEVVLQVDVQPHEIRNDGMLRADARPSSPRVMLSFESKHGPLSYPCDRFNSWQGNVRAIALGLEALRRVDRYGIAGRAEQYKGWAKLPPPPGQSPGAFANPQEAAEFLRSVAGGTTAAILATYENMVATYRRACVDTHPDHYPQHAEAFRRVQAAKEVLDRHFRR